MKKIQGAKAYNMSISPVVQTCIVSIILTAVITFMIWNTSGLNTVLENSTNSMELKPAMILLDIFIKY